MREWFSASFGSPTEAQVRGWPAIAAGEHTLILAPTGSGKTLTAFLWGIDSLIARPRETDARGRPAGGTRIVYVSPLRALAVDVDKNLRAPLRGIRLAAERLAAATPDAPAPVAHEPSVALRTGDTSADERRRLQRDPPDILITTPESLYLMLTSAVRETLCDVETVIIDEIHAVAATKRGSHLALTLERLEQIATRPPQRIGLSATQRPLDEVARFLGGFDDEGRPRPVSVVDAGSRKELEVEIVVPVDDMADMGRPVVPADPGAPDEHGPAVPGTDTDLLPSGPAAGGPVRRSIWPSMHPELLDLIESHRSTLVFVNARRLAERLATRLNELAAERSEVAAGLRDGASTRGDEQEGRPPVPTGEGQPAAVPELVKAHHGSLSREQRLVIEDELKSGRLRGLVATSSLELGIDMGAVDLVVQVESPGAVGRGLQRIGRAGHRVGEPSRGRIFPKHRADLLEAATVVPRMEAGLVEATRYPRNPVDVLAQQIVAMCALDEWSVDELATVVRRAAPFHELTDGVLHETLDLLAGRYPSEEFSELRPRIVWDRALGVVRGRRGAQRLAVTSGGTIPDRGLYGVFLPDGTRVGELDEEMVYESRVGETFLLGASTWRIEDITPERVVVTPAPGLPGKMPFWHGDGPGRPLELGKAVGETIRALRELPPDEARERLRTTHRLDERAAANLLAYLDDQAAEGVVPDDRTIVVERFRDEIGDWRVCVLSPFGARVHAPWAMVLQARLSERWGEPIELMWSDDGIVLRLPEAHDELPLDELLVDPDEVDRILVEHLPTSALFASRFRECAARALLLPRRRPDRRTPLWQQRQRAADLLTVAARHPRFPILYETTREILTDVFDVPALRTLLTDLRSRRVRAVAVDTPKASPFAQSLLFGWIAVYMYEGDAPLAERRAAALALDRDLLAELLGADELRDLLDAEVIAEVEAALQRVDGDRPARDPDEVHDLLRTLGPLSVGELGERVGDTTHEDVEAWVAGLVEGRRAIRVTVAGEARVAAADDAARLRDALGCALPLGLPSAYTEPVERPLLDLVARYARTHGPFLTREVAARYGIDEQRAAEALAELVDQGRVVRGEFRPGGVEREWCDDEVLRRIRRRSLAALRREVEPVDAEALARFLPAWQGVGLPRRGPDALIDVLAVLQGAPVPASVLEADVLLARMSEYHPSDLDTLTATGEVVWVGAGGIGSGDGRVRLVFRDELGLLVPPPDPADMPEGPVHDALRAQLTERGASFWPQLLSAAADAGTDHDEATVLAALWDLVWAGEVTNDTLVPLRALIDGGPGTSRRRGGARRGRPRPGRPTRQGPPTAAGRWSLVAPLRLPEPGGAEAALARAQQMLERHGVLTREAALAEGAPGGFAAVYPVLRALEDKGVVRRGYFVTGLGAAQFALPGAVERLRSLRSDGPAGAGADTTAQRGPDRDGAGWEDGGWTVDGPAPSESTGPLVLAATDPAQPYGAALPWPESQGRPARSAGAHVVLADGRPLAHLERGGRSISLFPGAAGGADPEADDARWVDALVAHARGRGPRSRLEVTRVDGRPVRETPAAELLAGAGFVDSYRGMVLRSGPRR